ncbi:DUF6886 family protein [Paractinoplanes atraurantiacus]|uniref:Uncharacterized protein n=1 Tax=Paractinoplanes atraurantiacus TaxID=1036182 RepID=A0A285F4X3_9ACTN|nr:DUF6886 family protein [Actinoplanes atraurantiacus]SNY06322.1 hypothetical protein SAMN05421748_101676 [Actinoplanes atraurantiacus]
MRPEAGQVLHFSEDPTIELFVPHVAATARETEAYVWAVGHDRAPDYWFPRQCPRAMAWVRDGTSDEDRDRIVGAGCGDRVHAIEYAWWEAMRTTTLYAYRLPAAPFRPLGEAGQEHAAVATEPVRPLGPAEPVGNLIDCHAAAGIQLRLLDNLWPFWDEVITSSLGFSAIRLRNARPRPTGDADESATFFAGRAPR